MGENPHKKAVSSRSVLNESPSVSALPNLANVIGECRPSHTKIGYLNSIVC
jgi:hypothetical protein